MISSKTVLPKQTRRLLIKLEGRKTFHQCVDSKRLQDGRVTNKQPTGIKCLLPRDQCLVCGCAYLNHMPDNAHKSITKWMNVLANLWSNLFMIPSTVHLLTCFWWFSRVKMMLNSVRLGIKGFVNFILQVPHILYLASSLQTHNSRINCDSFSTNVIKLSDVPLWIRLTR